MAVIARSATRNTAIVAQAPSPAVPHNQAGEAPAPRKQRPLAGVRKALSVFA